MNQVTNEIDKKETLQKLVLESIKTSASQNQLARKLKISPATLINIRDGKWDVLSDSLINRLTAYYRVDDWKLISTWNFKTIQTVCMDAMVGKRFIAIPAYTGAGKTTALRDFARNYEDVYYIHANSVMNKKLFLMAIQNSMGIKDGFSVPTMLNGIIYHMNSAKQPLLIIDDAGKLTPSILQLIQIIYDGTEFRAGIVMAGTEYLEEMMTKWVRMGRMGMAELHRRIGYWQYLREPNIKQIEMICANYKITDPACIKFIKENSTNYGDIRNIITNALRHAEVSGEKVTVDILEELMVGKHQYLLSRA